MDKFVISLESFIEVADALTDSKKALQADPAERFNKALTELLCKHIQLATQEAAESKRRSPGVKEYLYKAQVSKSYVETLAEQSITLLALYGITLRESGELGELQITLHF